MAEGTDSMATALKPAGEAPGLFRFNGIGTTMLGRFADAALAPAYFSILWVTLVWIPLIPCRIYLVSHPVDAKGKADTQMYRFHARIGRADLARLRPGSMGRLLWPSFFDGLAFIVAVVLGVTALAFAIMYVIDK